MKTSSVRLKLKIFHGENCPNCPPAISLGKELAARGFYIEFICVDEVDGMAEAAFHMIQSTPSIIVVNHNDEEILSWRGKVPSMDEILPLLEALKNGRD
ncbi:hypothetical protein B6U74_03170 [Candidatus Bathyarchaeota archaeon ex4484_205]|nr:MAG: hypothetical protein B6U74_03170 [Candidatus Bathyarchaeota archaeon ex4484_205]RLG68749.1 MAG: hypothetical protein DRN93_02015 [archaeon]